jgi:hypothetical protein
VPLLDAAQVTLALGALAGLTLLALILLAILALRLRRLRREYAILRGDRGPADIFDVLRRALERIDSMEHRVDAVVADQQEQTALARYALRKFSIIRYDAFGDMGGHMSFSAALLDEHGDGMVITSINGRSETRTYAKPVKALRSTHNLSDEEREAIGTAYAGYGRGDVEPTVSRS